MATVVLGICDLAAKATDGSESTVSEPTGTSPPKPQGKCRRMQFELDATLDNPAVLDKLRSMIHSRESERSESEADCSDCCSTTVGPMTEDSGDDDGDGDSSGDGGVDILQLTGPQPLDGEFISESDDEEGDCRDPSGLSHSNSTIVSSQLSNQSPAALESSGTVVDDILVSQSLSLDESAASVDDVALVARHVEQMSIAGEDEIGALTRATSVDAKAIATAPLTFGEYDFPLIHESYLEGESWRKGPLLGTGAFSSCYLGFDLATGQLMAVKQLALANNSAEEEQRILDKIAHEINLMRLFVITYKCVFSFDRRHAYHQAGAAPKRGQLLRRRPRGKSLQHLPRAHGRRVVVVPAEEIRRFSGASRQENNEAGCFGASAPAPQWNHAP